MTSEKEMAVAYDGKMADIAFQYFHHELEAERKRVTDQMKSNYRGGKNDPITLAAAVASLCALDDLEQRIQKKINKAREREKEIVHAPTPDSR